ncbi:AbiJ-NTD4 domain-containing protein [Cryobacterium sp. TMT4-31]|uniref:AbiJ-NTD4 domain-containing protein n=1 Tax=Cryobacterium sp. TMT4-31 TaxID=1259259 RepID=UPI001069BC3E|nr:hypothetical protein [Cryobacterium sp. TMT4-31]TFC87456.1 hypothetical protein E3T19_12540 [Cryobacterium sp. TMT4-31]
MTHPSFSEANGYSEPRTIAQVDGLDIVTRIAVWNAIYPAIRKSEFGYHNQENNSMIFDKTPEVVWTDFFGKMVDEVPSGDVVWSMSKQVMLEEPLNRVFDLLEVVIPALVFDLPEQSTDRVNDVFIRHLVGYRVVRRRVIRIDFGVESDSVVAALSASSLPGLEGVFKHIENSIVLLSERNAPDYPNTVKEAMSGVEAMCEFLTGKNQLGKALKDFSNTGLAISGVQIEAWNKMYGWASNENGVRHGSFRIPNVDHAIAKYLVITGAAFVSLLIEKAREAGKLNVG